MREIIMGYQGEMSLKGLNRNQFESAMMKILRYRLKTVGKFKVYCTQSTFYMEPEEEDVDMDLAFDRVRTVPAGENPALWLLDIIRRTAANKPQAEGTGFLPARRAAKKDALPGPQPGRHPLRRVCMTLLVLALLAALAAVGAWEYTNGNFYALPEQLHTLLTEHVPRPGATLV